MVRIKFRIICRYVAQTILNENAGSICKNLEVKFLNRKEPGKNVIKNRQDIYVDSDIKRKGMKSWVCNLRKGKTLKNLKDRNVVLK